MNLKKLAEGFNLKALGKALAFEERIGKADLGVLKVAFMVAALDGEVTAEEYEVFDALAKKCRGYTPETAEAALHAAMRSAGYLMLLSKRVATPELVQAFIGEAQTALPDGFAYLPIDDVRQAFVTWMAVGMSDGDYSERERACIEALRQNFAKLKVTNPTDYMNYQALFLPHFDMTGCVASGMMVDVFPENLSTKVEELVAKYGDTESAAEELKRILAV